MVLADELPLFRAGLRSIVERHQAGRIVAEAPNLQASWNLLGSDSADVLITEIRLSRSHELADLHHTRAQFPQLAMAVVSEPCPIMQLQSLFQTGVGAYLTRNASGLQVIEALRTLTEGGLYVDSQINAGKHSFSPIWQSFPGLTPREVETLHGLCEGLSPRQISQRLVISLATVRTHIRSLYRKFGVSQRTQLVLQALRGHQGPGYEPMGKPRDLSRGTMEASRPRNLR